VLEIDEGAAVGDVGGVAVGLLVIVAPDAAEASVDVDVPIAEV